MANYSFKRTGGPEDRAVYEFFRITRDHGEEHLIKGSLPMVVLTLLATVEEQRAMIEQAHKNIIAVETRLATLEQRTLPGA